MPGPRASPPLGLRLARTARLAGQAFDRAMAQAGGSAATWQVLALVRSKRWGAQNEMAGAMGISGATLTHHLNAMEDQGLVRRWRDRSNRRVQHVELTGAGEDLFMSLRHVAARHDRHLRSRLTEEDADQLAELLDRIVAGVQAEERPPAAPGGRA
ncbi:MarR family winged helix-turn-helix transcriptional regulator [Capillimicrobium parvum]|uniref:HTH marR-type domain-containing protein n=1 Tax=Capillimicrobium parvum TaxID=2884022 RepID=A0A9E6Y1K6_9ACTN|nr:MarR family winged helix-turn-helix transcriptional regulator [Capillimicrobium parvum]UGS38073.1 hypothetical protein DSM104329_04495 [Capillimicrobium parvum]